MTDKHEHTPGPWEYDGPKGMLIETRVYRIINPERFPAAFVPAWDRPLPGEEDGAREALANARLIAAAPQLLEALEGAIGALEFSRDYHNDLSNAEQAFAQDRLDAATKAIARARGAA